MKKATALAIGSLQSAIRKSWRLWVPVAILLAVALVQIVLAKTATLSPWKGGGFGMFATTDGTAFRHVRIFIEAPGRNEEIEVSPSQEFAASQAQLFPSDAMLNQLAQAVLAREQRYGRAVETIRLEVWRTEFSAGTLEATNHPLRVATFYVGQPSNNARQ